MASQAGINTGLRLPVSSMARLNELALTLGVSRNRAVAMLIDAAVIEMQPVVSVRLTRNLSSDWHDEEGNLEDSRL